MKNFICAFTNTKFSETLKRLENQITDFGFFDGAFLYNENNLDPYFKSVFKDKLQENVRGYGFWSWKPCVIKMSLDKIRNGDTLLYVDAGCHINKRGKKRLFRYYDILNKSESGIIVFQKPVDNVSYRFLVGKKVIRDYFLEYKWSKGDLFDYFNVRDKPEITQTPQIIATALFIKKTPQTYEFVNKWLNVFYYDLHLVDDTPSVSGNLTPAFKQSRHDQSILSILAKLNNVTTLGSSEIEPLSSLVRGNPILAVKDINGRMKYGELNIFRISRIIKHPFTSCYLFFKMRKIQQIKL